MSTKRQLKTVEELLAWIAYHARAAATGYAQEEMDQVLIVRQPPATGKSDWRAVDRQSDRKDRLRWSPALKHAIKRAQNEFDLK